ncbi:PQQ-dependent sugar dehydrogenase [Piscinibacter sp. XHJ-5]|uniref:PQQ-dependent sugar dehydrogenase n=1 Tax=Piscinibacter sp. XHJ-5 TaxID=3037797 RepID=UPI0024535AFE|nr:PQQ-dependent sugar dehydrogenase [Piscinibacter sp. XHJ-5]
MRRLHLRYWVLLGFCLFVLGSWSTAARAAWVLLANEKQSFTVSGTQTVRYGASSSWVQKSVTSSGQCTNAFFGRDPLQGTVKRCELLVPDTWTKISDEGQGFTVSGTQTVRYGASASWVQRSVAGSGQCTNAFFGRDPLAGVVKRCERLDVWTRIADEGHSFTVSGTQTVRYGANSSWIQKSITSSGQCTNAFFGRDPLAGVVKRCEVRNGAGNDPPLATIASPASGKTFRAGQSVSFSGSATDLEDGTVPSSRLTWWAELHHDTHVHPFQPQTSGGSGSVTIPVRGETAANIWYRFHLRATDSGGLTHEVTRDLLPQKSQFTLATSPAGLRLTLDGQPITAPRTTTGVVGIQRDLGAADQDLNGRRYRFDHWSDGGAATHTISTPAANTTYTATFTDLGPVVNQPPSVTLSAASTGTVGTAMTLSASAADSDGTIARVEFFDGSTKIGEDTTSAYSISWTPSSSGTHSLSARATDDDGAATTSAVRSVSVSAATGDTQAPSVALTAPANLATGLAGTLSITATASDNVGVQSVEFQVDGVTVGSADTAAPYSASFDTNTLASGQHIVRARARDAAGNVSGWATRTVSFGGSRSLPQGFSRLDHWGGTLGNATAFAQAPDGRLFVAQQTGALRIIKNGALLGTPFVSLAVDSSGERGLIGVALDPGFASNGRVYVHYTTTQNGTHNRISRFTASGDVAAAGSEVVLVDLPLLSSATNHNGGAMHFGMDGKLYVGVGDNANSAKAQNLADPFGKLLRFNADGSIPSDNPFYGTQTGLARAVWAYGLRNPFTFAVQPGTGRIHVNDVGQNTWEEINLGSPGANYGWPGSEGPDDISGGITAPLFTYRHSATSPAGSGPGGFFVGYAIAGGAFYPTSGNFPAPYRGDYFFADYVSGFVGRVDLSNGNAAYAFASGIDSPVDMLAGVDGALYVLTRGGITRISAP